MLTNNPHIKIIMNIPIINNKGNHALHVCMLTTAYRVQWPIIGTSSTGRIPFLAQFGTGSDAQGTVYAQGSDRYMAAAAMSKLFHGLQFHAAEVSKEYLRFTLKCKQHFLFLLQEHCTCHFRELYWQSVYTLQLLVQSRLRETQNYSTAWG